MESDGLRPTIRPSSYRRGKARSTASRGPRTLGTAMEPPITGRSIVSFARALRWRPSLPFSDRTRPAIGPGSAASFGGEVDCASRSRAWSATSARRSTDFEPRTYRPRIADATGSGISQTPVRLSGRAEAPASGFRLLHGVTQRAVDADRHGTRAGGHRARLGLVPTTDGTHRVGSTVIDRRG